MKAQVFGVSAVATLVAANPLAARATNGTMAWSFKDVPASANLSYTPCFQNFTCANLLVPLDYDNISVGTTNIAFLKLASPLQPAKGDIILNPGGPGGSGVDYLKQGYETLLGLVGNGYNLIGMDPRGVNNSGPNTDCFAGDPALRDYYNSEYFGSFNPRNPIALQEWWTSTGGFGDWCSHSLNATANYANTPATARDMVQYTEKLAESEGKPAKEAKLNYFGVSYGSTLGTTFAALFPDRVGRMIIDGVVDVEDHYGGSWTQNLLQADEATRSFSTLCYEAGPRCVFFRNDSSSAAIQNRFDTIINGIEKEPFSFSNPTVVQYPVVVRVEIIRSILLLCLYDSVRFFPLLATIMAELESRNAATLIQFYPASGILDGYMPQSECDYTGPAYSTVQSRLIIACNDMHGQYNISSPAKMQAYVNDLKNISSYVGEVWSAVVTPHCRALPFTPPKTQIFGGFKVTNTSNPILFTRNRIDPVAPSASKMSNFFTGSVVLMQDAIGHGLQVTKSKCTSEYLQKYLATGELPPAGTLCDVQIKPFQDTAAVTRREMRRSLGF